MEKTTAFPDGAVILGLMTFVLLVTDKKGHCGIFLLRLYCAPTSVSLTRTVVKSPDYRKS